MKTPIQTLLQYVNSKKTKTIKKDELKSILIKLLSIEKDIIRNAYKDGHADGEIYMGSISNDNEPNMEYPTKDYYYQNFIIKNYERNSS